MIDIFLHAPTKQALVDDLTPLGLAVDGEVVMTSPRHGVGHLGPVLERPAVCDDDGHQVAPQTVLPGVVAVVRCLDDALAVEIFQADFAAGTAVVDRPEHAPVLAGGVVRDLDAVKAAACAAIDAEAERRRLAVLTPGAGQALEYQHTAEEAARAVAAPDPLDTAAYPFLAAEQAALADTVGVVSIRDVAEAVLADRAAWMSYGAAVKERRRRGKLLVRAATSHLAVLAETAGIVWPDAPGA
ncbi:MAG: hypothetical protein RDU30_09845 [Desulfovibrionaceae bacterium]|nr:hypothetical protein [Desulfovibrionaceae bacterium]